MCVVSPNYEDTNPSWNAQDVGGTPNVYAFMGYKHMPKTERLGCEQMNYFSLAIRRGVVSLVVWFFGSLVLWLCYLFWLFWLFGCVTCFGSLVVWLSPPSATSQARPLALRRHRAQTDHGAPCHLTFRLFSLDCESGGFGPRAPNLALNFQSIGR